MGSALLQVDNVEVFYGEMQALFNVSLHVMPGETVVVLGGNASGKSTVVKTVLGLVQPRSGDVYYHGRRINGMNTAKVINLGLGSIPEGRRVFPAMSVRENLLMGAYPIRKQGKKEIDAGVHEALQLFPSLIPRMEQAAGTLSGGEQQMLVMARAWLRRPALLCIDEPSMGLSPLYVDKVYDIIRTMQAKGTTILMVDQNANKAIEVAHRVYVLKGGRIVLEGQARELAGDPSIRQAYLGEEIVA